MGREIDDETQRRILDIVLIPWLVRLKPLAVVVVGQFAKEAKGGRAEVVGGHQRWPAGWRNGVMIGAIPYLARRLPAQSRSEAGADHRSPIHDFKDDQRQWP